jgi:hypothetical protein
VLLLGTPAECSLTRRSRVRGNDSLVGTRTRLGSCSTSLPKLRPVWPYKATTQTGWTRTPGTLSKNPASEPP